MYILVECALPEENPLPEINLQKFETLKEAQDAMRKYYDKVGLPYHVIYGNEAMQAYDEYGFCPAYYWRIFDDADI